MEVDYKSHIYIYIYMLPLSHLPKINSTIAGHSDFSLLFDNYKRKQEKTTLLKLKWTTLGPNGVQLREVWLNRI